MSAFSAEDRERIESWFIKVAMIATNRDAPFIDAVRRLLAAHDDIRTRLGEQVDRNINRALDMERVTKEGERLRKDAERFAWWFSDEPKESCPVIGDYLRGLREHWTLDQWRAAIDNAMSAANEKADGTASGRKS